MILWAYEGFPFKRSFTFQVPCTKLWITRVSQTCLKTAASSWSSRVRPPAFSNSAGILHTPGALPDFELSTALSISESGGGLVLIGGSAVSGVNPKLSISVLGGGTSNSFSSTRQTSATPMDPPGLGHPLIVPWTASGGVSFRSVQRYLWIFLKDRYSGRFPFSLAQQRLLMRVATSGGNELRRRWEAAMPRVSCAADVNKSRNDSQLPASATPANNPTYGTPCGTLPRSIYPLVFWCKILSGHGTVNVLMLF